MREEFIIRALGKAQPFAEVCREFKVSRKTGYKWLERYQEQGLTGLVDESRRPDSSPTKVDDELVSAVLTLRREFPGWGAKKLRALMLRRKPAVTPPAEGTIARLLRQHGFVKKQVRRLPSAGPPVRPPRLDPVEPNDLWTVDFKGWWRSRDGMRCEPLTVRDAVSRYVLAGRLLASTKTEDVAPAFELLFDKYGLPKTIQSDNGSPFASTRGIGGLSQLSAWWVSLGINVVRSRPGCPQDNGGHERMHGDMLALQHASAPTQREQQRLLDEWITTFNYVRPHEALAMRTPSDVYRPSSRRRQFHRLGGFPDDCTLVMVKARYVHWHGRRIHIGAAFAGYPVGLRPFDADRMEVWFFHVRLGTCVPGVIGSFEVDGGLVAAASPRRRDVPRPGGAGHVVRRESTALVLSSSSPELATGVARTLAALFGESAGPETPVELKAPAEFETTAGRHKLASSALRDVIADVLADLDVRGKLGGLVAIPALRTELRRRRATEDDQAVNAALHALERAWIIDLSIAQDPSQVADRAAGIEDPRGLLYYVVRRAPTLPETTAMHRDAAGERRTDRVPAANDGAAVTVPTPTAQASTTSPSSSAVVGGAPRSPAVAAAGVTPRQRACNPLGEPVTQPLVGCNPVTSPPTMERGDTGQVTPSARAGDGVTRGGSSLGLHVSPPVLTDEERAALRLKPPTIPVGWPFVSDASRPSRRRKSTTKEPRAKK